MSPPLPPKPKVAAMAPQVLVVAALAATACKSRYMVRIGQPPPPPPELVRIGAQACAETQVVDAEGSPLTGARIELPTGEILISDADGIVVTPGHGVDATVSLDGYATQSIAFDCSRTVVVMRPEQGDVSPEDEQGDPQLERPPPRIGMPPLEDN